MAKRALSRAGLCALGKQVAKSTIHLSVTQLILYKGIIHQSTTTRFL